MRHGFTGGGTRKKVSPMDPPQPPGQFQQILLVFLQFREGEFVGARFFLDFLKKLLAAIAKFLVLLCTLFLEAFNQIGLNRLGGSPGFEKEAAASLLFHLHEESRESLFLLACLRQHPCSRLQVDRASLLQASPDQDAQTRRRGGGLEEEDQTGGGGHGR